jgi:formylglycine-generating enzyme required for sulfatase activity
LTEAAARPARRPGAKAPSRLLLGVGVGAGGGVLVLAAVVGLWAGGVFGGRAPHGPRRSSGETTGPERTETTPGRTEKGRARPALAHAPFDAARAGELQRAWAAYLGRPVEEDLDLGGGVKMAFLLIPPGTFTMGSPPGEKERSAGEAAHAVTINRPFYLAKYAVTQEQYRQLTGKNPSFFSAGEGGRDRVAGLDTRRLPVENVSWEDAAGFCRELAERTGRKAHLPSEAEWEYACRAGTTTPFHFGSRCNGKQANCNGNFPYGTPEKGPYLERPCAVGSYRPNAFGLYDMHGNILQWCQDWYAPSCDDLPGKDPVRVNIGPEATRVLRGGLWFSYARYCRAAFRDRRVPGKRDGSLGFRVAFLLD